MTFFPRVDHWRIPTAFADSLQEMARDGRHGNEGSEQFRKSLMASAILSWLAVIPSGFGTFASRAEDGFAGIAAAYLTGWPTDRARFQGAAGSGGPSSVSERAGVGR